MHHNTIIKAVKAHKNSKFTHTNQYRISKALRYSRFKHQSHNNIIKSLLFRRKCNKLAMTQRYSVPKFATQHYQNYALNGRKSVFSSLVNDLCQRKCVTKVVKRFNIISPTTLENYPKTIKLSITPTHFHSKLKR